MLWLPFGAQAAVDFTDVFDRHTAVMLLIDPHNGEIVRANLGAERFYGYSQDELTAMTIQDINQLDAEQVKAEMALAKSEGRNFFTFLHRLKSGETRTVQVSSVPIEWRGKKLLFSVISDVTVAGDVALNSAAHYQKRLEDQVTAKTREIKARSDLFDFFILMAGLALLLGSALIARMALKYRKTSLELSASEKRLNEIIWSSNVGTWEWEVKTGVVRFNEMWADLIGYTLEELAPITFETWASRVHEDDLEETKKSLDAVLNKEQERYRGEFRIRHKNGHWVWHQTTGNVVEWDDHGEAVRMAGFQADITEKKLIEEMKDNFISNVSHELRTPLTASKASFEMIMAGVVDPTSEDGQKLMEITGRNLNRLLFLVNDILDLERLNARTFELTKTEEDLVEVIAESIEDNLSFTMQYGVSIQFSPSIPSLRLEFDRERIHQVLANLLSNAAKFTQKSDEIVVRVEQNDGFARVTVSDNGKGIPQDFQHRVFGRFEKIDPIKTEVMKSSGLGLHICKTLIEMHGGRIGFTSKEGEGSTFYFELPLALEFGGKI